MKAVLTKKIGMTRVFQEDGVLVPVTVLKIHDNQVIAKATKDARGYSAVQVGFKPVKLEKLSKPRRGVFKDTSVFKAGYRKIKEFRVSEESLAEFEIGKPIDTSFLETANMVDITGVSKGKGFQGVIARYGQSGGKEGHGHRQGRTPGSVGMCTYPGRVPKGKKMPGHGGARVCTVQNVSVFKFNKEDGVILLRGAVPGAKNGDVEICETVK